MINDINKNLLKFLHQEISINRSTSCDSIITKAVREGYSEEAVKEALDILARSEMIILTTEQFNIVGKKVDFSISTQFDSLDINN